MSEPTLERNLQVVREYHRRTKHHYHAFARSLGYLDWANQPDPFRRWEGAERTLLPLTAPGSRPLAYDRLYRAPPTESEPVTRHTLGIFLQYSLGLSAWKEFQGSRWALRMNPSSGNLHPTEGYVILPALREESLEEILRGQGAVLHYLSEDHSLEPRARFPGEAGAELLAGFPEGSFLVGLSSIHWREAWKYGERAYRYCQHDVGHALAATALSARALGWSLLILEDLSAASVAGLLGIDRGEESHPLECEAPDLIAAIVPSGPCADLPLGLPAEPIERIRSATWFGTANRLSSEHHHWEVVDEVHQACLKPATQSDRHPPPHTGESSSLHPERGERALEVFAKRRSAVSMDGKTRMDAATFHRILDRVLPRIGNPVFEAIPWTPRIHLCLYVHPLLDGVSPGVYFLVRRPEMERTFRDSFRSDFAWTPPSGCPEGLPLFQLLEGDCRRLAESVSCGQSIAGDGVFSLGMIAEFDDALESEGPWSYPRLFWETGAIGQILYLEAVAAGVSATGIGCFFDDPVHQVLGLSDSRFQSLYHFTVGGAVEDRRLTTHPPYVLEGRDRG